MSTKNTTSGVLATETTDAAPQLDLFETKDDAAAAFLDRWTDDQDEKPASAQPEVPIDEPESEQVEEEQDEAEDTVEATEESEDDPEQDETDETETEEEEPKEAKVLEDEALVEIKVDDENLKVSVKDLKRLYGQEAALTKKSQQVAQKRKEIEQQAVKLSATLERMYKKAAEKWEPYSKVDMLVAAKTLDNEEFAALRNAAQAAYEEFAFVTQEVDSYVKEAQTQQQTQLREAAKEAVKVLKEAIPGWNQDVYGKIVSYGISQGLDAEMVNNLVDPVAIQILHKARLYDEGKKVVTKKVVKTAKKVMKPAANPSNQFDTEKKVKAARKFQSTGAVDDAAEFFLSRWQD